MDDKPPLNQQQVAGVNTGLLGLTTMVFCEALVPVLGLYRPLALAFLTLTRMAPFLYMAYTINSQKQDPNGTGIPPRALTLVSLTSHILCRACVCVVLTQLEGALIMTTTRWVMWKGTFSATVSHIGLTFGFEGVSKAIIQVSALIEVDPFSNVGLEVIKERCK